jgi:hypothetical protein
MLAKSRHLPQLGLDMFSSLAEAICAELNELALKVCGSFVQQSVGVLSPALLVAERCEIILGLRKVYG